MLRILKLVFPFVLSLVCISCETSEAKNYYLSESGNDNNSGTSHSAAWKTINKLNTVRLVPGDSVFLRAGDHWRETLIVRNSGKPGSPIVYSRYGNGNNPRILGSERARNWLQQSEFVWKSQERFRNPWDYYPGNVFFIKNDSVTWGDHKEFTQDLSELKKEYDWAWNGGHIYIRVSHDPGQRFQSIEVNQRARCAEMPDHSPASHIEINGIDMFFGRIAGFDAGYPAYKGANDLVFRNCNIGYIGERGSGYAYGIAAWHSDFLVENCTITDCGRRGISINLYKEMPLGENRHLRNIVIRNNTFKRGFHTTSLDLSSQMTSSDTIENVYFYNNLVDDSQHNEVRPHWVSNQIFTQSGNSYLNRIYIFNNIFLHATGRNILIEGGDSVFIWHNTICGHNPVIKNHPYSNVSFNHPKWVDYRNNILYDDLPRSSLQNHGVLMYYETSSYIEKDHNLYFSLFPGPERNITAGFNDLGSIGYTRSTLSSWNEYLFYNKKYDQHSPPPQDPSFADLYTNFNLTEGSPAIGAGVKIEMIVNDFLGNPMNDPPDLGAIQYHPK